MNLKFIIIIYYFFSVKRRFHFRGEEMKEKENSILELSLGRLTRLAQDLNNQQLLLFCGLSLIFSLWYSKFIFSPSSEMLGTPITDAYQSLSILSKNFQVFQTGHIPFGTFWLSNFYGGATATYFHVSVIPEISHTGLLFLSFSTSDFILSLKIYAFIVLISAQFLSYKLAYFFFKNQAISWIFSIGYSFSTFYLSQLNGGHCNFLAAAALLPGVLLLFEKMFNNPNFRNMIFANIFLIALFFGDLQITIFTLYYLLLRIIYYLIINKNQKTIILKRLLQSAVVFSLSVAPFLLSFVKLQNTGALSVPSIPANYLAVMSQFLTRNSGTFFNATDSIIYSLYIGSVLFTLALVPMILLKFQSKDDRRNYIFHLLTFIFFVLIALGTVFSNLVTILFVRVPSRDVILIDLSVCMCAGYGLLCLSKYLIHKSRKIQSLRKNKILITILILGLATTVFLDLTSGMSPVTSPLPKLTGGEKFIANQTGDFRVLQYPILWAYSNYEASIINHEILGVSPIALRDYPPSSELYTLLVNNFNALPAHSKDSASNITLLSTICGVKYVLIEKNAPNSANYSGYFNNASAYFTLVFSDQNSSVYENLYFKGTIFAIKDEGQTPQLENLTLPIFSRSILNDSQIIRTESFNRIEVSVAVSRPAYVILSQSYSPFWTFTGTNTRAFIELLKITAFKVDSGVHKVDAKFSAADQTMNLYVVFFIPLIVALVGFYAESKGQKRLLNLVLASLTIFGVALSSLSSPGIINVLPIVDEWAVFGIFNSVLLGFGCLLALASFLVFTRNKVFRSVGFSWNNLNILERFFLKLRQRLGRLKNKFNQSGNLSENTAIILIISMLLPIVLSNIPVLFSDANILINSSMIGALMFTILLYITRVSFLENKNNIPDGLESQLPYMEGSKQHITHLHLGIFGGILGIFIAGLLMRLITSYFQTIYFPALVLCGALGGLGFGAFTSSKTKLRGIVACSFGLLAIIFAIIMTYNTPIIIGYLRNGSSNTTPLYMLSLI